ncbi:hypothetical protein ABE504_21625 [Paenibacillus oryzisoli]|uniref:hypothetical protein n=1 Tax=Paenibacillus oryzisoli TaxID=1850517 RepID=UPI003D2A42DA
MRSETYAAKTNVPPSVKPAPASAGTTLSRMSLLASNMTTLHQTIGNQAVGRMLASHAGPGGAVPSRAWSRNRLSPSSTNASSISQMSSASDKPIQRALVTVDDIERSKKKKGKGYSWDAFKQRIAKDKQTLKGHSTGRGAKVNSAGHNSKDMQTEIEWGAAHPKTGEGTSVTATLGPDHLLGGPPDNQAVASRVNALKALSGDTYIAGHLLNDNLGGSGRSSLNLTAIPSGANSLHSAHIEEGIKNKVNIQGRWYKYIIDVDYSTDKKEFEEDAKNIKKYNKATAGGAPKGIEVETDDEGTATVEVTYASKLTAKWFSLDVEGKQFGYQHEDSIAIDSPLKSAKKDKKRVKATIEKGLKHERKRRVKVKNGWDTYKSTHIHNKAKTEIAKGDIVLNNTREVRVIMNRFVPVLETLRELKNKDARIIQLQKELADSNAGHDIQMGNKNGELALLKKEMKELTQSYTAIIQNLNDDIAELEQANEAISLRLMEDQETLQQIDQLNDDLTLRVREDEQTINNLEVLTDELGTRAEGDEIEIKKLKQLNAELERSTVEKDQEILRLKMMIQELKGQTSSSQSKGIPKRKGKKRKLKQDFKPSKRRKGQTQS